MGTALAQRLLAADYALTVWNRTPGKAVPISKAGAHFEPDILQAIEASELIIVCVTDGAASRNVLLSREDVVQALAGRTVAVLSTMSASESKSLVGVILAKNADCICGTILGYPSNVSDGDCTIAFSGSRVAFDRYQCLFEVMGGRTDFLSEDPAAAAIFDRAVFAAHYGAVVSFIQGAAMAKAAGLRMPLFVREATAGQLDFDYYAGQIVSGDYAANEATINIEAAAYADVPDTMRQLDLDAELAEAVNSAFQRALNLGYGHEGIAALSKVFRKACSSTY